MRREHPLTRPAAERLLDGGNSSLPGTDRLARVLIAARGPAQPNELVGEEAAVVAFRAAQSATVLAPPPRRTALAKILSAKAAAVLVIVTASGVAIAAVAGRLPGTDERSSHAPVVQPKPRTAPPAGPSQPAAPYPNAPTARPVAELCRAHSALPSAAAYKALDSDFFKVLVDSAGGKDKVGGYCATVVPTPPHATASATTMPRPAAVPTTRPAGSSPFVDAFSQALAEETAAGRIRATEAAELRKLLDELRIRVAEGRPDNIRTTVAKLQAAIDTAVRNQAMGAATASRLRGLLDPFVTYAPSGGQTPGIVPTAAGVIAGTVRP